MILNINPNAFDALYPFSLVTDDRGVILAVGRSLAKLCPRMVPGEHVRDHFIVVQPTGPTNSDLLRVTPGELVIVESALRREMKFRGHVVLTNTAPATYLFALKPLITSLSDITRMNLSLADFETSDPIFDFLMYMQAQVTNQQKLREAKAVAEWENRISKLLLEISIATEESATEDDVYRSAISSVCARLDWEFGDVFVVSGRDEEHLVSSKVCVNRDPDRLRDLEHLSTNMRFAPGEGLPGQVWLQRRIIWVKDVRHHSSFPRRGAVQHLDNLTAVGFPIFVGDEVFAVLEFFTQREVPDSENMRRFFSLLSAQLGGTIGRQRAERAARQHLAGLANASKMATLGELAAGVAHEINNPLHTLTLTNHLLRKLMDSNQLTPEMLASQINKVDNSIQRMSSIVGALKSFSRDSSRDSFQNTPLKLLIKETLDLSNASLTGQNVELLVSEIPESWLVECRPSQISQVILNLLNNAFDAIKEQSRRWIRLDVGDAGSYFEISVSDSGPPISKDIADKIMIPFFTTKPPGKGTGLGLSISSSIISDHGGALSLDRGSQHTRFVVTLPKRRPTVPHGDTTHRDMPDRDTRDRNMRDRNNGRPSVERAA